jgi:hypothetical protein
MADKPEDLTLALLAGVRAHAYGNEVGARHARLLRRHAARSVLDQAGTSLNGTLHPDHLMRPLEMIMALAYIALGGALIWYVISHQDARNALKEVCTFVQSQSVLHAEALQRGDPPHGLEDAIHACWKEGELPEGVETTSWRIFRGR